MYFQSEEHEERFKNLRGARNCVSNDVLTFCYLVSSDLLRSKATTFAKIEKNEIHPKRVNLDNTPFSSTEKEVAKLAMHLYSTKYKAPNLNHLLSNADSQTKSLVIQAINLF